MKKLRTAAAVLLVAAGIGTLGFAATRPTHYAVTAYGGHGRPLVLHRAGLIAAEHLAFALVDDRRDFVVNVVTITDEAGRLVDTVTNTPPN